MEPILNDLFVVLIMFFLSLKRYIYNYIYIFKSTILVWLPMANLSC